MVKTTIDHEARRQRLRRKAAFAALVVRLSLAGMAFCCGAAMVLTGGDYILPGLVCVAAALVMGLWAVMSDGE